MLNACVTGTNHNGPGGKLLLGNVNLYIDGPTSGNYSDGTSGIGTPAIIIPSFFWGIEGVSRGASANGSNAGLGTFISPLSEHKPASGMRPSLSAALVPDQLDHGCATGQRCHHHDDYPSRTRNFRHEHLSGRIGNGERR